MVFAPFILAASSIFGLSQAAPLSSFSNVARSLVARDGTAYKVYGGDGSLAKGWPSSSDWVEFEAMWEANSPLMKSTCMDDIKNNSDEETAAIKKGIEEASKSSGIDQRFLLAAVMQESGGCVRVGTTYSPAPDNIRNPGLLQDFNGDHTCNDPKKGIEIQDPCPEDQIIGMITDGAGVTNDGGFKQAIEKAAADDDSKYYKAARIYNSGSIDPSGNLGKGVATHCYASDMANRLMGWLGDDRTCDEDTIGNEEGSDSETSTTPSKSVGTGISGGILPTLAPTAVPFPNGTVSTYSPIGTGIPTATGGIPLPTGSTGSGSMGQVTAEPAGPKAAGAAADCQSWYAAASGDDCGKISSFYGLPTGTLQKLNTGLNEDCTNLELGTSYCVRGQ